MQLLNSLTVPHAGPSRLAGIVPLFYMKRLVCMFAENGSSSGRGSHPVGKARSHPQWALTRLLLQNRPHGVHVKGWGFETPPSVAAFLYRKIEDMFICAASSVIALSLLSAAWSRTQLFGPYPR